jgi:S1/P1 Nuclease
LPEGDRGGTRFYIRVRPDRSTISLHQFWDDLVLGSQRFQTVRNTATRLRLQPEHQRNALPELNELQFNQWAMAESFPLAKEVAYRNGTLQGSRDRTNGTVLPPDYPVTTKPTANRRIILAGYRLADLLQKTF